LKTKKLQFIYETPFVTDCYGRLIFNTEKYTFGFYLQHMKETSVQELKEMIDKGEDFQLIDVREDFEYEVSNLGGTLIPLGGILIEADKVAKDKPVVVQCRSGKRSAAAIMQLEQLGYTNLYNLRGGILAWASEIDPNMNVY
jgi:rhodanese-related sulfurtransferase